MKLSINRTVPRYRLIESPTPAVMDTVGKKVADFVTVEGAKLAVKQLNGGRDNGLIWVTAHQWTKENKALPHPTAIRKEAK